MYLREDRVCSPSEASFSLMVVYKTWGWLKRKVTVVKQHVEGDQRPLPCMAGSDVSSFLAFTFLEFSIWTSCQCHEFHQYHLQGVDILKRKNSTAQHDCQVMELSQAQNPEVLFPVNYLLKCTCSKNNSDVSLWSPCHAGSANPCQLNVYIYL